MGEIVPRWEWRTFGDQFRTADAVFAQVGAHEPNRLGRDPAAARPRVDRVANVDVTLVETVGKPGMRSALLAQGAQPVASSPEDLKIFLREEAKKWADVIRSSGARAE